jgi:hypothetical protein
VIRVGIELFCELVTERQAQPILSGFRQHDRGRGRDERLKLIEIRGDDPFAPAPVYRLG